MRLDVECTEHRTLDPPKSCQRRLCKCTVSTLSGAQCNIAWGACRLKRARAPLLIGCACLQLVLERLLSVLVLYARLLPEAMTEGNVDHAKLLPTVRLATISGAGFA